MASRGFAAAAMALRCCVVSKAREPATFEVPPVLAALKLSVLRRRAEAAGIAEELLDDAEDSEEPREALIRLILEAEGPPPPPAPTETELADSQPLRPAAALDERRRRELQGLRLLALQRRAARAGVDNETLEETLDCDDPKGSLIELLLTLPASSAREPEPEPQPEPEPEERPADDWDAAMEELD